MTQDRTASSDANLQTINIPKPHPALKRLERLVGAWDLKGRTLDAQEDNIRGHVTIEWLPGGFFLQQRGELDFMGLNAHSLEIVGYDPVADNFPATVFSSMDGAPAVYYWDVQGDVVTHWTAGSKYTGTFSADGSTLTGGWRPDSDVAASAGNAYDATMMRVK